MTGPPTDGPAPIDPVACPGSDDGADDLGAGDPRAGAGADPVGDGVAAAGPDGPEDPARVDAAAVDGATGRAPATRPDGPHDPGRVDQRPHDGEPTGERLQKVLARAGIGSRRVCEELIADGRVTVNGAVAELGRRVEVEADAVSVDGVALSVRPGLVHYLLNKPAGVVTTSADPQGRPTVIDLLPSDPRVFSVGRLDIDTEGLLVLTNDGDLAHRLTHPRYGVEKEYLAIVAGVPTPAEVRRLREGVQLDDGLTAPAKVSLVEPNGLRIVIHEGRNRQVRRMCEVIGHPVIRLVRSRIGPVADRALSPGQWRPLTAAEVRALETAAAASEPKAARPPRPPRQAGQPRQGRPGRSHRGGRASGHPK
ncbi:MAG TPA: pseudouridine synthase [Acidimicrobiales bacterium]|jgi:23S rRNA pseudouridine2605 synthase